MRKIVICLCLASGGCAASPTVRYMVANSPQAVQDARADLIDSYVYQKNEIRIDFRNKAEKGKPPIYDLNVTNTKIEDPAHRLMLLRGDRTWTRTTINLAKVENTDLIATAGVEVEDRRAELIQTAGTIIKTVIPLVGGVAAQTPVPGCGPAPSSCILVPTDVLTTMGQGSGSIGESPGLKVFWGPIPTTAIPTDGLFQTLYRLRSNGLYYAACREFQVKFVTGTGPTTTVQEWRGKIADPRWSEFVAFPRKGNVRMHAQCGVSTTSEKDPTKSTDELVNAAVTQAIAVKEALDKANADEKKK